MPLPAARSIASALPLTALLLLPYACGGETASNPNEGAPGEGSSQGGVSGAGTAGSSDTLGGTTAGGGDGVMIAGSGGAAGAGGAAGTAGTEGERGFVLANVVCPVRSQGTGGQMGTSCESPTPVLDPQGNDTGYVCCADGSVDRHTAVTASATMTFASCPTGTSPASAPFCATDADCTAHTHGVCSNVGDPQEVLCRCIYACRVDSECDAGEVCAGATDYDGSFYPVCVKASCRTDADCASGRCGVSNDHSSICSEGVTLACRTDADACDADADCPQQQCIYENGSWECQPVRHCYTP